MCLDPKSRVCLATNWPRKDLQSQLRFSHSSALNNNNPCWNSLEVRGARTIPKSHLATGQRSRIYGRVQSWNFANSNYFRYFEEVILLTLAWAFS